jgi:hypothetical protein
MSELSRCGIVAVLVLVFANCAAVRAEAAPDGIAAVVAKVSAGVVRVVAVRHLVGSCGVV